MMLEFIIANIGSFLHIFLILVVMLIIIGYLFEKRIKTYVNDNWEKYKANAFFVFFGGFFRDEFDSDIYVSAFNNFVEFINGMVRNLINGLMFPFIKLSEVFIKLLSNTTGTLNVFRAQFAVMRGFMFKMASGVLDRLNGLNVAFTMFFLRAREGLKKQASIFNLIAWTVAHSYYFMYSTFMGPVGNLFKDVGKLQLSIMNFAGGPALTGAYVDQLCFHPDTLIFGKKIQNLDYDDDLNIIGKVQINVDEIFLYRVNNTYVTGSHYLINDGIFEIRDRVKNCSFLSDNLYSGKLNCLVTRNGIIKTDDGSIYGDFMDVPDNRILRYIQYMNLKKLNEKEYVNVNLGIHLRQMFDTSLESDYRIWGYHPETILLTNDGELKISEIGVGSIIDGNEVSALIHIRPNTIDIYEIEGVKLSGNNIIFREKEWIRVKDIEGVKYLGKNENEYINLVIRGSIIYLKSIEGMIIGRDYLEIDEVEWNEVINEKVGKLFMK